MFFWWFEWLRPLLSSPSSDLVVQNRLEIINRVKTLDLQSNRRSTSWQNFASHTFQPQHNMKWRFHWLLFWTERIKPPRPHILKHYQNNKIQRREDKRRDKILVFYLLMWVAFNYTILVPNKINGKVLIKYAKCDYFIVG